MIWIFIIFLLVLVMLPSVQALIVTPNNFNASIEDGQTYSDHFRIVPENLSQNITIYSNSPFSVSLSQDSLENLSTYYDLDFSIEVPKQFPAGNYESTIFVTGENQTRKVIVNLDVLENLNFTAVNQNEIEAGNEESGIVIVNVKNTGNKLLELFLDVSQNEVEIYFDESFLEDFFIYPNMSVQIPITFVVPKNLQEGIYISEITIGDIDGNIEEFSNITFTIVDNIPPEIESVKLDDNLRAGINFQIGVEAFDNLNISEVTLFFNMTNESDVLIKETALNGTYIFTHNIKDAVIINMTVTATDNSGNQITHEEILELGQYNDVNFNDIEFVKINKNELFRFNIFDSDIPVPFCMELNYLDFVSSASNTTYDYFLYVDDVKEIITGENLSNTTSHCFNGNSLKFAFKSNKNGRLDTEFVIGFPDWVQSNETINIGTDVSDKTIKKKEFVRIGTYTMNCTYDNSWNCNNLTFPRNTDINELGIPLSQREYSIIMDSVNKTKEKYELQLSFANGVSGLQWIAIVMFIIVGMLYYIFAVKGISIGLNW